MNMHQQTQGQPPGNHSVQNASSNRQPWHDEASDIQDRRFMLEHIINLFRRQKSSNSQEWNQRLPDMVRRLEENLYNFASSKEEYKDMNTLSQRLQHVAKLISSNRATSVRNSMPSNPRPPRNPTMIPTPGTTMIPTPGLTGTPPAQFATPSSRRDNLTAGASTMVSGGTPRMVQNAQHAASNMVASGPMQNGHVYHNPEPSLSNGSPFIGGNQYPMNGNSMHSSSSYFGQGQIQRERYQIQKTEAKMIPVPGLPPQVLQKLQSEQQNQKKEDSSQPSTSMNVERKKEALLRKRTWMTTLCHALTCKEAQRQCSNQHCSQMKSVLLHVSKCQDGDNCKQQSCMSVRHLLAHRKSCRDAQCIICPRQRPGTTNSVNPGSASASTCTEETVIKRVKEEVNGVNQVQLKRPKEEVNGISELHVNKKAKLEPSLPEKGKAPIISEVKMESAQVKLEPVQVKLESKIEEGTEVMSERNGSMVVRASPSVSVAENCESSLAHDHAAKGKTKVIGISLMELFTTEQIKDHITSLRLWIGQSKAKAEKNQAMEMSENACRLCAVERLTFEPPPLYCTTCGVRIKRSLIFYTAGSGETRLYFCSACYNAANEIIEIDGTPVSKTKLEKKRNDEETEEAWVQCDKCNQWQHQICALFNGRRNEGGDAEYTCPHCLMDEMETGTRKPLPATSVLVPKDLPRTHLSDHLEQRLFRRLKQERLERARAQGKSIDEVPGAEGLVVRVVSSVDKKLEVKPRFLEIFKERGYPSEYLYKSKVILLFQKIEGVEVCLFGMYVQEFGAECPEPNNRRLYIAYLDSVKYFRPEVRTVTGEALRTFVYHELLIGYLEYSKRRGFGSCYIWACPPLRGEDYILYCHPEIQKTPKSDKLREWYLTMLGKATKENIVVELTNFYDYFFVSPDECKADVTAARLPYFDGDYWPGAAEDVLQQLNQEDEERRKLYKKAVPSKKGVAKRVGVSSELTSNQSKDLQLMHKLGHTISPMKEDFILVHMHHSCRHCRLFITSGLRWVCKQCKSFQLCNRCYIADQKSDEKDRHPWNSWNSHEFYSVEVNDVPPETKDKDDIMESEFFDTRQAFLSLCQGNHYQHDTLRRAKHSSMMVLYHLHNPTAPAFVTSCNLCQREIENGKGWRCDICADFDVCAGCYPKELPRHPHKLKPQVSAAERDVQNTEARQLRHEQLRRMMVLLVHSSQCCAQQCQFPKCRNVKNLFRHGTQCRTRVAGGCSHCKMMWHLLQLHARACKESECRVPRCKDLKEHLRRSQKQSESRRRAAVMEMIRQRTSDIASASSAS